MTWTSFWVSYTLHSPDAPQDGQRIPRLSMPMSSESVPLRGCRSGIDFVEHGAIPKHSKDASGLFKTNSGELGEFDYAIRVYRAVHESRRPEAFCQGIRTISIGPPDRPSTRLER